MNTNRRTSLSALLAAGLIGLGLAGGYSIGAARLGWAAIVVSWGPSFVLLVLASCVGGLALWAHKRVQVQQKALPSREAIWLVSLGKSALLTGVVLTCAYFTVAGFAIPGFLQEIPGPTQRLAESGVAAAASALVAVAGFFLEGACIVPHDDESGAAAAC